jgi:apolipoprotein D and lipocalin family protein
MRFFFIHFIALLFQYESSWAMDWGGHVAPLNVPVPVADNLDLNRYAGKWYEIVRMQQFFEHDCAGVTAEYSLRSDGKVDVTNTCRKNSCEGKVKIAHGVGRVADPFDHSKLKVSFFWPFEADYWVLEVDPNYSIAVVGSPDRKSFWILSRSPKIGYLSLMSIIQRFQQNGYLTDKTSKKLVFTQPCE